MLLYIFVLGLQCHNMQFSSVPLHIYILYVFSSQLYSNVLYLPTLAERRILNLKSIQSLITNQIETLFLLSQIYFKILWQTFLFQKTFHIPSANTNY